MDRFVDPPRSPPVDQANSRRTSYRSGALAPEVRARDYRGGPRGSNGPVTTSSTG